MAAKAKKDANKLAAEHRVKWLERMAQEAASTSPGTQWESILNRMIISAKQQAQNKKLSAILRPDWSSLDFIEVPNERWFLAEDGMELYEFQDGIFIAHRQIESTAFEPDGIIKVLPDNTRVVEVEETEDALYILEQTPTIPSPPTW
jgi:hypothetical protein